MFFFFFLVFFSGIAPHERGQELEGKEAKQSKAKQSSHESWTDVVLPVASRESVDRSVSTVGAVPAGLLWVGGETSADIQPL